MTYLLAIAAATLLRAVAIASAIVRATVVQLRLVAQALAGIGTSELGQADSRERRDVTHDRCYSDYINTIPVGDTARLSALCCNREQSKS